ncbi:MAG TPA: hypothetical protein VJW20_15725 [Candidatus Angelobacter sp.]|nr:hypothetical protein [Candidatus Angelobacter sp.]
MTKDRFSRSVFLVAGIYGIVVLAPGFFTESMTAKMMPPAITHPEFYYGFFGVGLAWQVAFLIIAADPARFRPIIPAAVLEKLIYFISCFVLHLFGRAPLLIVAGGTIDLVLGALFAVAYVRLKPSHPTIT